MAYLCSIGCAALRRICERYFELGLSASKTPIRVATYSYYDKLPDELSSLLPSPDAIATIIQEIGDEA